MTTNYEAGVYSFQDVKFSIVGPNLNLTATGEADEGYSIEFDGDSATLVMGAGGDGMTSVVAKQNGTVTLRLLKTGVINQQLSNAYTFQRQSAANTGRNVLVIADPVRGDTFTCSGVSFRKFPNISYASEGGTQDWVFNAVRISPQLGAGTGTLVNG